LLAFVTDDFADWTTLEPREVMEKRGRGDRNFDPWRFSRF
jgi:homospermidine synthase